MTNQTLVFDEVQIGIGLRPLAQHGYIVVGEGMLMLLGNRQESIDQAPLGAIVAAPVRFRRGQVVCLTMNGTKYNVSPGWGRYVGTRPPMGAGREVKKAAQHLLSLFKTSRAP